MYFFYIAFANLLWAIWTMFFVAVACGSCSRKISVLEEFTQQFGPIIVTIVKIKKNQIKWKRMNW